MAAGTKPQIAVWMRIAGVVGGLALGALFGAILVMAATMFAEWRNYTGYIPEIWMGSAAGTAIGLGLGVLYPEKLAAALAQFISEIF